MDSSHFPPFLLTPKFSSCEIAKYKKRFLFPPSTLYLPYCASWKTIQELTVLYSLQKSYFFKNMFSTYQDFSQVCVGEGAFSFFIFLIFPWEIEISQDLSFPATSNEYHCSIFPQWGDKNA